MDASTYHDTPAADTVEAAGRPQDDACEAELTRVFRTPARAQSRLGLLAQATPGAALLKRPTR